MKSVFLKTIALATTLALSSPVLARPNAGAPDPNAGASAPGQTLSFEQFQANYGARGARISAMGAGETREANLISLISEMGTYLVPMTSDSLTQGPQVISSKVSGLLASYRKLKAATGKLPAGSPKIASLQSELNDFIQSTNIIDNASSAMNDNIDHVSSTISSEEMTVLSRYSRSGIVAPTETAVSVFNRLLVDYRAFNTYEKACRDQVLHLKSVLDFYGLSPESNMFVADVESTCMTERSKVDSALYSSMSSEIQGAVASLHAQYRIIN